MTRRALRFSPSLGSARTAQPPVRPFHRQVPDVPPAPVLRRDPSDQLLLQTHQRPVDLRAPAVADLAFDHPVYDAASLGTQFLLGVAGVYPSSTLEADAELVNNAGNPDAIRGTMSGMKNGDQLNCTSGCLGGLTNALLSLFTSSNCAVSGVTTCFPLAQFQSLPIGNAAITDNAATQTIEGAARGFFISMQTQAVSWKDLDSNTFKEAVAGAYLNIPKYRDANGNLVAPININFDQAFGGIPRADTCFGAATKGC